jgi:hypothetical protein
MNKRKKYWQQVIITEGQKQDDFLREIEIGHLKGNVFLSHEGECCRLLMSPQNLNAET